MEKEYLLEESFTIPKTMQLMHIFKMVFFFFTFLVTFDTTHNFLCMLTFTKW